MNKVGLFTEERLTLSSYLPLLEADPQCGAISTFSGIIRCDLHLGKQVVALEYEAYKEMAEKVLAQLLDQCCLTFPDLRHLVVVHRVGRVPVGDTAVVVLTAAPHRKEALAATSWLIDQVKVQVPIWKKQILENGETLWLHPHC